jgi:hypothetical protein
VAVGSAMSCCSTDPTGVFSLISRYKYEDLWPCSASELQSFGRPGGEEDSSTASAAIASLQNAKSRHGRNKSNSKGGKGRANDGKDQSHASSKYVGHPVQCMRQFLRVDVFDRPLC